MEISEFDTHNKSTWCPGCGDFGIWISLKNALKNLNLGPSDVTIVYGIGCHGNMYNWMRTYAVEGLHGRALPLAQGLKLANHKLPVICIVGDGDCIGEGGNHFIHAAKRNPNITVIIHDNQLYSLTTGQASPTANQGFKTKTTPEGAIDEPLNPLVLALSSGATFVSRAFAGDSPHLSGMIAEGISHPGFSVVDVLQPCVTFDKVHTYAWYRSRIYDLVKEGFKTNDRAQSLIKALEWGERIPVGKFFEQIKPTQESIEPALKNNQLISSHPESCDVTKLLKEFI